MMLKPFSPGTEDGKKFRFRSFAQITQLRYISLYLIFARGHWFHYRFKIVLFLEILKIQRFLNQYQACLYLFECISHGDSKYSNEVQLF